ncbi:hypothetical protein Tco_0428508 [Tanacetum coccineum]
MSDMTAYLNDLSYIPINNEQNEPTQGDIGETSNAPTQAKRNEFEELYSSRANRDPVTPVVKYIPLRHEDNDPGVAKAVSFLLWLMSNTNSNLGQLLRSQRCEMSRCATVVMVVTKAVNERPPPISITHWLWGCLGSRGHPKTPIRWQERWQIASRPRFICADHPAQGIRSLATNLCAIQHHPAKDLQMQEGPAFKGKVDLDATIEYWNELKNRCTVCPNETKPAKAWSSSDRNPSLFHPPRNMNIESSATRGTGYGHSRPPTLCTIPSMSLSTKRENALTRQGEDRECGCWDDELVEMRGRCEDKDDEEEPIC